MRHLSNVCSVLVFLYLLGACAESGRDPGGGTPTPDVGRLVLSYTPVSADVALTNVDTEEPVDLSAALVSQEEDAEGMTASYDLAPATYEIAVSDTGYQPFSAVLELAAGQNRTLEARLIPLEPGQVAPVAAFSLEPAAGTAPLRVEVDASASSDGDGSISAYRWDFGDGTLADGLSAEHTYNAPGDYVITLRVTDDDGLSSSAARGVSVNAPPVASFVAEPDPDDPLLVSFDASGSSDADGTLVAYTWTFGDGAVASTQQAEHRFSAPGSYQVRLRVTDDDGAEAALAKALEVREAPVSPGGPTQRPRLSVGADGRSFLSGGEPFFWLADTLWLLFSATREDDALRALDSAKAKGFNVVQTFLVAAFSNDENPGANAYGELPFMADDPAQLNPAYFDYVASVIEAAAERGLYVAVTFGEPGRSATGLPYGLTDAGTAYAYGRAVGERFRAQTLAQQIVWLNGHDRNPDRDAGLDIWLAMSEGLADGVNDEGAFDGSADYSTLLLSYHPDGGFESHGWSSSEFFHASSWLDFNAINVWKYYADLVGLVAADRARTPAKPTVCYEPSYEAQAYADIEPITAWQVRLQGYWCALSGAAGYSYGHSDGYKLTNADSWPEVLESEGRADMIHLLRALGDADFPSLVPAQALIGSDAAQPDYDKDYVAAARTEDGSYAFVYSTRGGSFDLDLTGLAAASVKARWFDPREGSYSGENVVARTASQSFDPPGEAGEANDWLLVLDARP